MAENKAQPLSGPNFRAGTKFSQLIEHTPLLGHFDGEPAVLVRQGDQVFATGAICSPYGGPLAEGLVVGETIRCPWHHARFDLRTGEAIAAPALNSVSCFIHATTLRDDKPRAQLLSPTIFWVER